MKLCHRVTSCHEVSVARNRISRGNFPLYNNIPLVLLLSSLQKIFHSIPNTVCTFIYFFITNGNSTLPKNRKYTRIVKIYDDKSMQQHLEVCYQLLNECLEQNFLFLSFLIEKKNSSLRRWSNNTGY